MHSWERNLWFKSDLGKSRGGGSELTGESEQSGLVLWVSHIVRSLGADTASYALSHQQLSIVFATHLLRCAAVQIAAIVGLHGVCILSWTCRHPGSCLPSTALTALYL